MAPQSFKVVQLTWSSTISGLDNLEAESNILAEPNLPSSISQNNPSALECLSDDNIYMQTHDSNGTCAINRDDFALNDDNVASISPPPFLADRSSSLSDRTFYPLPTLASQHLSLKPLGSLDVLNIGKKKFNLSPDSGIQFLQEYGYFSPPPLSPKEIAQFLIAESETLSKASIGQYFGGE